MATIESTKASFFFSFSCSSMEWGEEVLLFGVAPRFHSFQCASFILHPRMHTHTQREKWYGHLFRRPTTLFVFWFTLAPKLGQRCHRFAFSFFFPPPDGFYFWFLLPLHPPYCRYSIPDYFSCVFQGVHLISPSLTGFAGVSIKREYTRARSFSFGQKREFHNEDLRRWWASWSVRLLGRWGHYRFLPRCVCCVCEGVPLCSERWSCEGLLPSSNLCGTAGHGRARLDWRVQVDEYFQPQRWVRVFLFFGEARVLSIVCVVLRVFVVCVRRVCARAPVCLSLSLFPPSLCCVTLQVGEVIISLLKIDILCVQESIYLSALLPLHTVP